MSVKQLQIRDDVRRARDAESAHLQAALRVSGAKSLRLQRLRDVLQDRGVAAESLDLKLAPGEEPALWLNLSHCVTMKPDAANYHLAFHGAKNIENILETSSLDDMVATCSRILAHSRVQAAREQGVDAASPVWDQATLVYVWFTGLVTGVAALTVYAIILKKLVL